MLKSVKNSNAFTLFNFNRFQFTLSSVHSYSNRIIQTIANLRDLSRSFACFVCIQLTSNSRSGCAVVAYRITGHRSHMNVVSRVCLKIVDCYWWRSAGDLMRSIKHLIS